MTSIVLLVGCARSGSQDAPLESAPEPAASLEPRVEFEVPGRSAPLCSGHVTGAPSTDAAPGAHISWYAFSSAETAADLYAHYEQSLGREADAARDGCRTWRQPPVDPRSFLEVCPLGVERPWSECGPLPRGTASVVVVSSMTRAERDA